VLGWQGFRWRARAPRLPAAPGPRHGCIGDGALLRLRVFGDSVVAGVGLAHSDEALPAAYARELARGGYLVEWRAQGRSGARLADLLPWLAALDDCDVLLLSAGTNDAVGVSSLDVAVATLRRLLALARQRAPGARVVFAGLPPLQTFSQLPEPLRSWLGWRCGSLDLALAEVMDRHGGLHVPLRLDATPERFCPDRYHPNARSHAEWAAILARRTQRRWPRMAQAADFGLPAAAVRPSHGDVRPGLPRGR